MRALSSNFMCVVQSQRELTDTFCDLSQKMPELHQEFACNAESQKTMFKSGEMLVGEYRWFSAVLHDADNWRLPPHLSLLWTGMVD